MYLQVLSCSLDERQFGYSRHEPKFGVCAPSGGASGGAGSASNANVARAEAYNRTKWHLDPSSRLVTINVWSQQA